MVHEVADDDGTLTARTDIDAAMAGRVARRGGEPKRVVKLKVIVDQQRLTGRDHRLTVKPPDVSGWIVSALNRFLPKCHPGDCRHSRTNVMECGPRPGVTPP